MCKIKIKFEEKKTLLICYISNQNKKRKSIQENWKIGNEETRQSCSRQCKTLLNQKSLKQKKKNETWWIQT